MKVAAFIGTVLLATALNIGIGVAIVLATPDSAFHLVWMPVVGLAPLVLGPVAAGAVLATWDPAASESARRSFHRMAAVLVGLQALGVLLCALFVILTGAPAWLPFAFLAGAPVTDLLALRIGPALRRRDPRPPLTGEPWRPIDPREIRRKVLAVVVTFVAAFVIVGAGTAILFAVLGDAGSAVAPTLFGAELALLSAGTACAVVNLPVQRMVRERVSGDVGLLKRLAQVVLRGRAVDLDPEEQRLAARYAAILAVTLSFTLGSVGLIYAALALGQVERLVDGSRQPFPIAFLVVIVVVAVALFPLQIRRIRRARIYAEEHAQLL